VQASERLGVKKEVAYHWVRVGLLKTVRVEVGRRIVRHVSAEGLEEFRRLYVTGVELAASMGSRSRRWSSRHLMTLGLTPVSGPTVDGARQFLFRREDVTKVDAKPLKRFVRGKVPVPDDDENEALLLVRSVGRAAARHLGLDFRQISNRVVDYTGMTVVQVVTGRRNGFSGAYRFIVSASQIQRLNEARQGYLALGFVGLRWFLLVPWQQTQAILRWRSTTGADIFINVVSDEPPNDLLEFRHELCFEVAERMYQPLRRRKLD
jgi:hypothetical protein